MPTLKVLPRTCAIFGCQKAPIYRKSYCKEHAQNNPMDYSRNAGYRSASWKTTRGNTLSSGCLCESCKQYGRITNATVVDHVWNWKKIDSVALVANWFQSLCVSCHSVKTSLESRGIYRHFPTMTDYNLEDYWRLVRRNEHRLHLKDDPSAF